MQQVVNCRNCGIQVSIDTSLKIDQVCPACDTVLAIVKKPQPNQQGQYPHGNTTQSGQHARPATPAPHPTSHPANTNPAGIPQDPYAPDPVQAHHISQPQHHPVQQALEPIRPQSGGYSNRPPTSSNTQLFVGLSIGGGLLLVIVIAIIVLLSGNSSDSSSSQTANNSSLQGTSGTIDSTEELKLSATYRPLPNLSSSSARQKSLGYKWSAGQSTTYNFKFVMRGSETVSLTGTNRLTPSRINPSSILGLEGTGGSTGSCFFVHPDGLAVTCAHVVEGADKVEVRVNNQWRQAKVVDMDSKNDLALLKISQDNMPVLPIASSSDLELAQSIHIIGFPIQDVLGSSVKFNSGAITGFKTEDDSSDVLFDANINPGNSGGPLIDQSGNVVGVATAMLQGEGLNSVAVAVMSDRIFDLLKRNNISLPVSTIDQPREKNSELAKMTTPAVCLVKTGGRSDVQVVNHTTRLSTGDSPLPATLNGELVVDSSGEVLKHDRESGGGVCVYLLSPSTVGIEKLSASEEDKWQYRGATVIAFPSVVTKYVPSDPGYSLRGRYGIRPRPGGVRPQTEASLSIFLGLESNSFSKKFEDAKFTTYIVAKNVQSIQPVRGQEGYLNSRLIGTMKYNKLQGRVEEMKLTGNLSATIERQTKSYSITYEYSVSGSSSSSSVPDSSLTQNNGSSSIPSNPSTGRPTMPRDPSTGRPSTGRPSTGRPRTGRPGGRAPSVGRPSVGNPRVGRPGSGVTRSFPKPSVGSGGTRKSTRTTRALVESDWKAKGRADKSVSVVIDVDEFDKRMDFVTPSILGSDTQIAFSPDSRFLFCGSSRLWVFDTNTKKLVYESDNLGFSVSAIAVARNTRQLVTAEGKGVIRVISYDQNGKLTEVKRMTGGGIGCDAIAVSDDGKTIVSGSWSELQIWDVAKDSPVHEVKAYRVKAIHMDASRNEVTVLDNNELMKVDLQTGKKLGSRKVKGLGEAGFSADGKKVAVCDASKVNEVNLENGNIRVFDTTGITRAVRFHPTDGRLITIGRGKINFWNPQTRFRIDEYELGDNDCRKIVVSPEWEIDGDDLLVQRGGCSDRRSIDRYCLQTISRPNRSVLIDRKISGGPRNISSSFEQCCGSRFPADRRQRRTQCCYNFRILRHPSPSPS